MHLSANPKWRMQYCHGITSEMTHNVSGCCLHPCSIPPVIRAVARIIKRPLNLNALTEPSHLTDTLIFFNFICEPYLTASTSSGFTLQLLYSVDQKRNFAYPTMHGKRGEKTWRQKTERLPHTMSKMSKIKLIVKKTNKLSLWNIKPVPSNRDPNDST